MHKSVLSALLTSSVCQNPRPAKRQIVASGMRHHGHRNHEQEGIAASNDEEDGSDVESVMSNDTELIENYVDEEEV